MYVYKNVYVCMYLRIVHMNMYGGQCDKAYSINIYICMYKNI